MFLHLQNMVLQLLLQTTVVSSHSTWIDNIVGDVGKFGLAVVEATRKYDTIRYDTRCYFNVRS